VPITVLLDLHFAPDHLEDGPEFLAGILIDTRNFDGCESIEVLTDLADNGHVLVVEQWASLDQDLAYRAWRAGDGANALGSYLAEAPTLTKFGLAARS
jgi:quinol monooxygenase YgiN